MKSFETLLQNACEDYFSQFDREPTLDDVAIVCSTPIANVVWKALRVVGENRKHKPIQEEPTINGVSLTNVKKYLGEACRCLLGHRVGDKINAINYLFKLCPKYGFKFAYGTNKGLHESLKHTYDDNDIIVGACFSKNKK